MVTSARYYKTRRQDDKQKLTLLSAAEHIESIFSYSITLGPCESANVAISCYESGRSYKNTRKHDREATAEIKFDNLRKKRQRRQHTKLKNKSGRRPMIRVS